MATARATPSRSASGSTRHWQFVADMFTSIQDQDTLKEFWETLGKAFSKRGYDIYDVQEDLSTSPSLPSSSATEPRMFKLVCGIDTEDNTKCNRTSQDWSETVDECNNIIKGDSYASGVRFTRVPSGQPIPSGNWVRVAEAGTSTTTTAVRSSLRYSFEGNLVTSLRDVSSLFSPLSDALKRQGYLMTDVKADPDKNLNSRAYRVYFIYRTSNPTYNAKTGCDVFLSLVNELSKDKFSTEVTLVLCTGTSQDDQPVPARYDSMDTS